MSSARLAFLSLPLWLSLGCVASVWRAPGMQPMPDPAIGVLEVIRDGPRVAYITEVDGQPRGTGSFNRYELMPGTHSFTVKLHKRQHGGGLSRFGAEPVVLWVNMEAGKVYSFQADADLEAERWDAWIIDKATGGKVSYRKGNETAR